MNLFIFFFIKIKNTATRLCEKNIYNKIIFIVKKIFSSIKLRCINFIKNNNNKYRAAFYTIFNINKISFFHYS